MSDGREVAATKAESAIQEIAKLTALDLKTTKSAVAIIDGKGGAEWALEQIAIGRSIPAIAKSIKVNSAALIQYLNARVESTLLMELRESGFDHRFDSLYGEAEQIEEDHRRVKAMTTLLTYMASKETVKYKDRQEAKTTAAISISVDWTAMAANGPPQTFIIENE